MRSLRSVVLLALLFALVAACTTSNGTIERILRSAAEDPRKVMDATRFEHDHHRGVIVLRGPMVYLDRLAGEYFIRGWIDPATRTLKDDFQIAVDAVFKRRVYLDQAYSAGQELPTKVIDRLRICESTCRTHERIGIAVSPEEMVTRAETGLSFKISGRRDAVEVNIPPGYFAGVLAAYHAHRDG